MHRVVISFCGPCFPQTVCGCTSSAPRACRDLRDEQQGSLTARSAESSDGPHAGSMGRTQKQEAYLVSFTAANKAAVASYLERHGAVISAYVPEVRTSGHRTALTHATQVASITLRFNHVEVLLRTLWLDACAAEDCIRYMCFWFTGPCSVEASG